MATAAPAIAASVLAPAEQDVRRRAQEAYLSLLTGSGTDWWSTVILTAGSQAQAELYRQQIRQRRQRGHIPRNVSWQVVADPEGRRIGSGGATLQSLQPLGNRTPAWWKTNRVLIIHGGGESRRLPEYSLTGKLFGILPDQTPWGENSTVFDETLVLSTLWLNRTSGGLTVASGDVVLTFDETRLEWEQPGVVGAAIAQPPEVGARHGVYVLDDRGRVYAFLQKPQPAAVKAAGGILRDGQVALDIGLLHFDPELSASLAGLACTLPEIPFLDLYQDFTLSLTGEAACQLPALATLLRGAPFHCSLLDGVFTHVGTTSHFRRLFKGGIVDSILAPESRLSPGALAIECHSAAPLEVGVNAIAHGLTTAAGPVNVPDDTVMHQVPVLLPDGRRGFVIRTYGVEDDPKKPFWFGRPIPEDAWTGVPPAERCLWNAQLFLFNNCELPRLSLASSTEFADAEALSEARERRRAANWRAAALALARAETDVRPLLLHAPGVNALTETAGALTSEALQQVAQEPSSAASRHFQSSLFYEHAGLHHLAAQARTVAFHAVQKAVAARRLPRFSTTAPVVSLATASAPARIDFGGGWSDTPPFCLDWGGTVFNMAVILNGRAPIRTLVRQLSEPVVRLVSAGSSEIYQPSAPPAVGSPFAIHRAALALLGFSPNAGLEIRTEVDLPVGSGLGTSSILAATIVRALLTVQGKSASDQELADLVLSLEQLMTTGGGWQDQVGGIWPGAKLTSTGPGPDQRLRVEPVPCPEAFSSHFVFYYTGIRRIAKDLLSQVVGRYLAREVQAVQVLHSIKTLAVEMAYAMRESDWPYFGSLLDRHWQLNQILDPHTTNAPINSLLHQVRPYIHGAKLAGAGGGGFLMLLARSPEHARDLKTFLAALPGPGALYEWSVARRGLDS